jgi:hypothetical protein
MTFNGVWKGREVKGRAKRESGSVGDREQRVSAAMRRGEAARAGEIDSDRKRERREKGRKRHG